MVTTVSKPTRRTPTRFAVCRFATGFTQAQIGAHVGVTREHVARLEAGTRHPRETTAIAIAELLGVRVEDLWPEYASRTSPDSSCATEADAGGLGARR
jgi:DNA-binding XRE family transcriptional regulator